MMTSPSPFPITGKTKLLGVIGYPIEHSLSPVMHNAALAALGANYAYLPFAIDPADLPRALAGFEAIGLQGFNVTIPHKQAIMPLLNDISAVAQAIGAVNTVCRTEAGWYGTNTDLDGFLAPLKTPLKTQPQNWTDSIAVVLGNGGAARAVVAGCHQLGCKQIVVVGRDRQKLEAFRQSWQTHPASAQLTVSEWQNLPEILPQTHLLVNTTPIGMAPHSDSSPIDPSLLAKLSPGAIAYDLIYTPRPTQFLQQAEKQGLQAIDGLEMLVQQGAAALQLWLHQPAPVDVMRSALLEFLRT